MRNLAAPSVRQITNKRSALRPTAIVGLLALGFVLAACGGGPVPTQTASPAIEPTPAERTEEPGPSTEVLSRGAEIYAANCQTCHGDKDGQGGNSIAPPHNESGHTWHHPDAQLKEWVLNGKIGRGQMPPFKDQLTEEEVDAVLAYIKTWWTEDQRTSQADVSQRYQEALEKQKQGQ